MITDIQTPPPENDYNYIAYWCKPTDELRGRSDPTTIPCKTWQIRRSKLRLLGRRWNIQAKCPNCGNRPRLSGNNSHVFNTLEDAKGFIEGILKFGGLEEKIEDDWNNGWTTVKRGEEE